MQHLPFPAYSEVDTTQCTPKANFSNEVLAVADGGLARSRGENCGARSRRGHLAVRDSHFALAR